MHRQLGDINVKLVEQINNHKNFLKKYEETLAASLGGQYLKNEEEIYDAIFERIVTAKRHIRVVLLESRPEVQARILNAIADKLKRKVEYTIVVVRNPEDISGEFDRNHKLRIIGRSAEHQAICW